MTVSIPLFPLNTVLFPEGELQLRLFEPRYIDMVRNCMRDESGFGICLISDGKEAGVPAEIFPIGTYSKIINWEQTTDGLLGITVRGEQRFKIVRSELQPDKLRIGEVVWLDEDDDLLTEAYQGFSDFLKEIAHRCELPLSEEPARFEEANWVSGRLAELLPFDIEAKQTLLEMDSAVNRLDYMKSLLKQINAGEYSQH